MTSLPDRARELLDGKNFAVVTTIQPDGAPQASVVWVKRDGDNVLFSTAKGRRKHANLLADPRVSVVVTEVTNPYEYVEVRGRTEILDDPQALLIEELAQKYTGRSFDLPPGQQRVIVRVTPSHVVLYE